MYQRTHNVVVVVVVVDFAFGVSGNGNVFFGGKVLDWLKNLWVRILYIVVWILFF